MSYKNEIDKLLCMLDRLENQEVEILDITEEMLPVYLFSRADFEEGQLGYRVGGLENESLIGNEKGDWKESWFVIGYEELMGDPFFVDVKDIDFPVYTAEHGMGEWEPLLHSDSLKEFLSVLTYRDED
ncbi:hypothetical protein COE15_21500 [Bacillus cereus]|uniref:hypothetical protein n=1 Tax=unclassified Bacillus (in: firmicutes) TaxID=185979 RepID=UPI00047BD68E|nr:MULTISPECIES: hypothetical protein [unclassified Bacillus (in: firmicutes)]PFD98369.1 hypothetical protein CN288_20565 [Bacillus sp. AFS023182]PGX94827.1 hypothetical protein COE15_21500 [Bacillus cereus]